MEDTEICALPACSVQFKRNGKQKYCSLKCSKKQAGIIQAAKRKKESKVKRGLVDRICDRSKCGKRYSPIRKNQRFCCTKCNDMHNESWSQSGFTAEELAEIYGDIE